MLLTCQVFSNFKRAPAEGLLWQILYLLIKEKSLVFCASPYPDSSDRGGAVVRVFWTGTSRERGAAVGTDKYCFIHSSGKEWSKQIKSKAMPAVIALFASRHLTLPWKLVLGQPRKEPSLCESESALLKSLVKPAHNWSPLWDQHQDYFVGVFSPNWVNGIQLMNFLLS